MRSRSLFVVVATVCVGLLAAGCTSAGVRAVRSQQHAATESRGPTAGSGPDASGSDASGPPSIGELPDIAAVAWSSCVDYPAPYECGRISVPLDYTAAAGRQIELALIRLPAADPAQRIGSLVLNPGGPGASGLELVATEGQTFPAVVRDRFDIVGFDPRGVGESSAVRCPSALDPAVHASAACSDGNSELLTHLGTRNVARDLEMIRRAIGDEQLTYLGFSYGTALGAVYADMFPQRVRAMVLDGAVDPDAGRSNTAAAGSDFYADQDFEGTIAVFEDLCDATPSCPAGPHTRELVERITDHIGDLGVASFPAGNRLTKSDVEDVLVNAMYNASDWPLLAVALAEADKGDASTMSALSSWLLYGYPADASAAADETFANDAIRCADFARRGAGSFDCSTFPDAAEPLPAITAVDTSAPILVVGTRDDPATPARYAPRMAAALGDAVAIEWEGAGHTATLTSACITDLVTAYLVELQVPGDGTTCPFVPGTTTLAERADAVFSAPDPELAIGKLADTLQAEGDTRIDAECVAAKLVARGNERLVVHQLLGVDSPELLTLRATLEGSCR